MKREELPALAKSGYEHEIIEPSDSCRECGSLLEDDSANIVIVEEGNDIPSREPYRVIDCDSCEITYSQRMSRA